jgi:Barstar (barnase inhibitor)
MSTDKNANSGVVKISSGSVAAIIEEARRAGAAVYKLPSNAVTNKAEFFEAVRRMLPLDPPLVGSRLVWDALSDSMFGGLVNLDAGRIAIIWPNAEAIHAASPADYEMALSVLRQVIQQLRSPLTTVGRPKDVTVYLA